MTRSTPWSRSSLATAVVGLLTFALVVPPGAQAAPVDGAAETPAVVPAELEEPPAELDEPPVELEEPPADAEPVAPEVEEAEFEPLEPEEAEATEPEADSDTEPDAEPDSETDAETDEPDTGPSVLSASDGPVVATSDVTGFGVVGVTWSGDVADDALVVEVRTSTDPAAPDDGDAGWDAWEEVSPEPSPDGTLDGTEPVVVGDVARVQARVTGSEQVRDLTLNVVDPGTSSADGAVPVPPAEVSPSGASVAAVVAPSRPSISSRAAWGADERIMTWTPRQGSIQGAIVHHTAGTNSYARADVPRIIRGIYAYHAQTRDWGDIGYNFLVDKFGRTWEGRSGGITRQTIGGHAVGYNTNTTGVSVLGNYDTATVSNAAVTAVVNVLGWKLGLHGVPATGNTTINGTRVARIIGHRTVSATACPGRTLNAKLGEIRRRAAAAQAQAAARQAQGSISHGSFVVNPKGNLAMVENGRRHVATCSMVRSYGGNCNSARKVTTAQWKAFLAGGRLQQTVRTLDGRLFRVSGGTKREAFDMKSLERAKLKTATVSLNANAISRLKYGKPIVRPGVVVINRANGNHRLVVSGAKGGYLGSALRNRTQIKSLDRGRLDGASVSRMPKVGKTTGVIKRSNGRTFVVTTNGLVRIDGTGKLRASTKTQNWGPVLMNEVTKRGGKSSVVALRQRGKSQVYILRNGVLRPVTAARARQLNGGKAPTVHVILKLTRQQFPVGSRL